MKKFAILATLLFAAVVQAVAGPNVTFPNCPLTWRMNEVFTVCWDYTGPAPQHFQIGLSNNGGQSYDYTLVQVGPNVREWSGRIGNFRPDYPTSSDWNDRVRVRAVMPNGTVVYGEVNRGGNFRIARAL
ncbi:hypothetical protein HZB60_12390 [candidate division KSB1 bacterium]|nr:hypothetical protein [candidate division KSB1 bacterium]